MSFRTACTFAELIEANVAFLEGRLLQTPYHLGPVDDETNPLLAELIVLNRSGFLTVNGQPNRSDVYFHSSTQKWVAVEQRPFLEGYMDLRYLSAFRVYMQTDPLESNCVYHAYKVTQRGVWSTICCGMASARLHYLEGDAPRRMCVTWDKEHTDRKQLAGMPWRARTFVDRTLDAYDFCKYAKYSNISDILSEAYVKIILVGDAQEKLEQLMTTFMQAMQLRSNCMV